MSKQKAAVPQFLSALIQSFSPAPGYLPITVNLPEHFVGLFVTTVSRPHISALAGQMDPDDKAKRKGPLGHVFLQKRVNLFLLQRLDDLIPIYMGLSGTRPSEL